MSCWKEKSLHWALNKFCGLDTSTDFAQAFWLMLCIWRVPRKVPSLSLHHPVPPKSLTHVKARHGKQNIISIYIYFWINRSVFIFISNTLKSLQGLTKATRTELPSGIFINTDMQTQEVAAQDITSLLDLTTRSVCASHALLHLTHTGCGFFFFFCRLALELIVWKFVINP